MLKLTKFGSPFEGDSGNFYSMVDTLFSKDLRLPEKTFKIDVQETEKDYVVEAELAGIKKEEIKLDFKNNNLLISVNKVEKKEEQKKNYIHKETNTSSMSRSLYLRDAQDEGIKAKLENGILRIIIPKKVEEIKKNKIEIE